MIYPAKHDLLALRWQPFRYFVDIVGVDLTDGVFRMEVRQYLDQTGAALITLPTANLPVEGVWLTKVETVDGVPVSTLRIMIGETTIEGLLPAATSGREPGDDLELVYDLVITAGNLIKSRWLEGKFIVRGGSTQG